MKRITYIAPIEHLRGSLAPRQSLEYSEDGAAAYEIPTGESESARNYQTRLIAKVARLGAANQLQYFQVRTRSSVNMSATYRHNCALMGGVGALIASLLRDKSAQIYSDCVRVKPAGKTLRAFLSPILRAGLDAKSAAIVVADGVSIVNPWVSSDAPNVPVSAAVLDKFSSELSNT